MHTALHSLSVRYINNSNSQCQYLPSVSQCSTATLYVAVSFIVLCVLLSAVQQIVLKAADCIDRNGMERVEVVASIGKVGGGLADGT